jgi:hypothetical protein
VSPTGPRRCWAVLVLAGLPGLSYSLPVGAAIAFLMLAVGISCHQTIRPTRKAAGPSSSRARNSAAFAPGPPTGSYLWTLHEQRPDLTLTVTVPELVDRHWWHRILHAHVAERL